jgi:cation diffusion facilitator CzcD-associated flavoprotein CzcO
MHTAPADSHINPLDEGTASGDTMDICIIGGGVSGLSALQVIMGTPQYKSGHWKPTLFEARDKVGGVW